MARPFSPNDSRIQLSYGAPDFAAAPHALCFDVSNTVWYYNPTGASNAWSVTNGPGTLSPRNCHTGTEPAIASTSGTEQTPVTTEIYFAEVFVPAPVTVTGIAVFNGGAVAGTVKVGLYSAAGTLLATNATGGAGTTQSGTDAYQRVAFTAPVTVLGPQTCYVATAYDNTSARGNTHTVGNFGAGKLTTHVFTTAMETTALTGLTMPTTFTTALGPIASLY